MLNKVNKLSMLWKADDIWVWISVREIYMCISCCGARPSIRGSL